MLKVVQYLAKITGDMVALSIDHQTISLRLLKIDTGRERQTVLPSARCTHMTLTYTNYRERCPHEVKHIKPLEMNYCIKGEKLTTTRNYHITTDRMTESMIQAGDV